MTYDRVDPELSVYRAGVTYGDVWTPVLFPGGHDEFDAAADRARKLCAALCGSGEQAVRPFVGYSGDRPHGFPRNGVRL